MTIDMERLRKLLLVMLSADQAGEVAAAAAAVTKLLKHGGKDIHWLANRLVSGAGPLSSPYQANPFRPQPPAPSPPSHVEQWAEDLRYCAMRHNLLRPRDHEFIVSMTEKWAAGPRWYPTQRQRKWLEDIVTRLKDQAAS